MFQYSAGDNLACDARIPVNCLAPGESTTVTLELTSPAKPGIYQCKYRMCTSSGSYFGGVCVYVRVCVGNNIVRIL